MYPKSYADHFRTLETQAMVFVAMPFGDEFRARWQSVFRPAIKALKLRPHRVDVTRVSDSILTDILKGICSARLILADISADPRFENSTPNPNVMYELGLAHALRLPEEVIVVRDAGCELPFDLHHVRCSSFEPTNTVGARRKIVGLLKDMIKEVDLSRSAVVEKVLRSLDPDSMRFLYRVRELRSFDLYPFDLERKGLYTLGAGECTEAKLRRVARQLIAWGALEAGNPGRLPRRVYGATPEYEVAPLGKALMARLPKWLSKEEGDLVAPNRVRRK